MCVLLDMMSMCIAGFHPPAPPTSRNGSSMMDREAYGEDEDEDQLLWREKLRELLDSKVGRGWLLGEGDVSGWSSRKRMLSFLAFFFC